MVRIDRRIGIWATVALMLASVGCSKSGDQPDLGKVSGTITMDGSPVVGKQVTFAPDEGRGSHGITDSQGKYELMYMADTKGAKVGNHKVYITTPTNEEDDSDPDAVLVEETIPAKYNKSTTLTADVKSGKNTFDFQLESE